MTAAIHNFELEQGTSLTKNIVWKDSTSSVMILTGYTARLQVRETVDSDAVLIELSTDNGKIEITPLTGAITLLFEPSDTIDQYWTKARYDLELTSADGTLTRILKGKITLSKEVTRD